MRESTTSYDCYLPITFNGDRPHMLRGDGYDDADQCVPLPCKREVCWRCRGEGVHDHPAFSNGLTAADLDDRDFREDYLAGHYDVPCEECRGQRVVWAVDEASMTPDLRAAYRRASDELIAYHNEVAAERRCGA